MSLERRHQVLKGIIDAYQRSGQPSGSKFLKEHYHISASPATIRNDMAKLESAHLIEKTHSSSGRVPTEAGYRYYLNHIVPQIGGYIDLEIAPSDRQRLNEIFAQPYLGLAEVIHRATIALAELTNYVAISVAPTLDDYHLSAYRFVPLTDRQAVLILMTEEGTVENQIIHFPSSVKMAQVEEVVYWINQSLASKSLTEAFAELKQMIDHERKDQAFVYPFLNHLITKLSSHQVEVHGKTAFLSYLANRQGIHQAIAFDQLLKSRDAVIQLMPMNKSGIQFRMGDEIVGDALQEMTIASQLVIEDESPGKQVTLALIGPENMSYVRTAQLFKAVKYEINRYLENYS